MSHEYQTRKIIVIAVIVIFLVGIFVLKLSHNEHGQYLKETRFIMGTYVTITGYHYNHGHLQESITAAFREMQEIDRLMSTYKVNSELTILNNSPKPGTYPVSELLYEVLNISDIVYRETDGAFDVTIKPLMDLWKQAGENNSFPDQRDLNAALNTVGWTHIALNGRETSVSFGKADMQIVLGGVAKGYAVDLASQSLKKAGIQHFMVDAGGDIYCSGHPPRREAWIIGVRDPINTSDILNKLRITNQSVVTSGNYERFYTIDGKHYSQIFYPETGMPVETILSSTVIADTAARADAWATALMVLGPEKGLELINQHPDLEAFIIATSFDGKVTYSKSEHFDSFISE
ncbi:MAG: FAD:protein FMN transferase [Candidatus Auribacter fodinae]|jgi:thiamine biosynthesis lipoprotein|uniref:FAD:protein FMN transferase n=1 Tax=Candidatus Auribacter fodinae TaxID=2093366 RepID=A0A3A4R9N6_9BACT|nr:MAG: FAD:protein FMN transferase [Candidatus Auribacter fodinae]